MAKVAKNYGGYYGVHVGSEGFEMQEELAKTLRIASESQIPVHVYHLKMRAKANWGRIRQVIDQLEEARREGLEITANQYPYTAMQHPWRRLFPRWVQDAPVKETIAQFKNPDFRERVIHRQGVQPIRRRARRLGRHRGGAARCRVLKTVRRHAHRRDR